jgi:hypothetical protein
MFRLTGAAVLLAAGIALSPGAEASNHSHVTPKLTSWTPPSRCTVLNWHSAVPTFDTLLEDGPLKCDGGSVANQDPSDSHDRDDGVGQGQWWQSTWNDRGDAWHSSDGWRDHGGQDEGSGHDDGHQQDDLGCPFHGELSCNHSQGDPPPVPLPSGVWLLGGALAAWLVMKRHQHATQM